MLDIYGIIKLFNESYCKLVHFRCLYSLMFYYFIQVYIRYSVYSAKPSVLPTTQKIFLSFISILTNLIDQNSQGLYDKTFLWKLFKDSSFTQPRYVFSFNFIISLYGTLSVLHNSLILLMPQKIFVLMMNNLIDEDSQVLYY